MRMSLVVYITDVSISNRFFLLYKIWICYTLNVEGNGKFHHIEFIIHFNAFLIQLFAATDAAATAAFFQTSVNVAIIVSM